MTPSLPTLADWRAGLRQDATASRLLRGLGDAARVAMAARDAEELASGVLAIAARLADGRDGAVLARGGAGVRVLAAQGAARPVGATVPGAGAWPAFRDPVVALAASHDTPGDWCLDRSAGHGVNWRGVFAAPGGRRGLLVLRLAAPPDEDLELALSALAAQLAPLLAGPSPRRGPRRGDSRHETLTPRERQVLALLPRGLSNAELGRALGVAPATIKTYVEGILRKLQCRDRTQAAVMAVERGWAA